MLCVCLCSLQVKALTSNLCMTLAAADYSDLLEVNNERTKVRRKEPLPQWLMGSPTSRLLLVWNNDHENPSLLLKALEKFTIPSSVCSIQVLRPGEELPKDLQCYSRRHKELGQRVSAVVQFKHLQAVRSTFNALKEEEKVNKHGLCVKALGWTLTQSGTNPRNQQEEDSCSEENPVKIPKVLVQHEASSLVKATEENSKTFVPEGWTSSSQSFCGLKERYNRADFGSRDHVKRGSQSPWVLRCKAAADAGNSNKAEPPNTPRFITIVLRQPKGPDGTRGFNYRRE